MLNKNNQIIFGALIALLSGAFYLVFQDIKDLDKDLDKISNIVTENKTNIENIKQAINDIKGSIEKLDGKFDQFKPLAVQLSLQPPHYAEENSTDATFYRRSGSQATSDNKFPYFELAVSESENLWKLPSVTIGQTDKYSIQELQNIFDSIGKSLYSEQYVE